MKRVLDHLKEKQQSFAASPFVTFLQDGRLTPRARLGFLPCLAPFVMGFEELSRSLQEGEAAAPEQLPGEGQRWILYLKDLQALEPETSTDLTGILKLLWGEDCTQARRALYELFGLAMTASPVKRQVLTLALHALGSVVLRPLDYVARELEMHTGQELAIFRALRRPLETDLWTADAVELDLRPGMEREALEIIDEVSALIHDTAEELLAYAWRRLDAKHGRAGRAGSASQTFQEFGNTRLQALCDAAGYSEADTRTVQRFFTFMSSPWGTRRIGTTPPWLSDITDDHTPFELSLALEGGRPEVRFLIEAQSSSTTLRSSWEEGLALNERLHQEFGVPLERFNLVKDLFAPTERAVRFSLWHAFVLKPGGRPELKVYLNPAAQGADYASAVVKEALDRLGFSKAWRFLCEVGMRRGMRDQILYFSLDLSAHQASRVKIYLAHKDASAEDIEAIMSRAKEYVPGEARAFCERLQGGRGRFQAPRSTLTCLAFTSDDDERPYSVTLHFPLRCYARDDQDSLQRIRSVLEPRSYAVLEQAVRALAHRPLEAGVGLIQWASMRWQQGLMRTTFYLATEAYGTVAPCVAEPPVVHVPGPPLAERNRLTA